MCPESLLSCGPRLGSQDLTDKQSELQATEKKDYWGLKGIRILEPQGNKLLKIGDNTVQMTEEATPIRTEPV